MTNLHLKDWCDAPAGDANLASPAAQFYANEHVPPPEIAMTALHTPEYRQLVQALVDARLRAGLSQYDIAARLGVEQSFVSKYEHCRRRLDVLEFFVIVSAVGLDPSAFVKELSQSVGFPTDLFSRSTSVRRT